MALGEVDYGLFGVIGGLTVFIAFFNNVLAFSISRFYATSIGKAAKLAKEGRQEEGLEECRKWFSIALVIHTVIPILLMIVGYPIGEWAVRDFLTIPPDKVAVCVWAFRFVCMSCFIGMVCVPFNAMYQAKQYIAELTVYSLVTTSLNICFLYYMVSHPASWLGRYAFWTCVLNIMPQLIIAFRAIQLFPECHLRFSRLRIRNSIKELFSYTGWQMFGAIGGLLRGQGMQILINKYHGPAINASMTIANTVNGHTQTLAASLVGAFQPAISTAWGQGDTIRFRALSYRACKFGMILALLFVIPLSLELPEVMRIWLGNPPRYATEFCWFMMAVAIIERATVGHVMAINATVRIAAYQMVVGGLLITTLPLAWLFIALGFGPLSIGWAMVAISVLCAMGRVFFARSLVGLSPGYWTYKIIIPVLLVCVVTSFLGFSSRLLMTSGICRIMVTTAIVEITLLPIIWRLLLDEEERDFVLARIKRILHRG